MCWASEPVARPKARLLHLMARRKSHPTPKAMGELRALPNGKEKAPPLLQWQGESPSPPQWQGEAPPPKARRKPRPPMAMGKLEKPFKTLLVQIWNWNCSILYYSRFMLDFLCFSTMNLPYFFLIEAVVSIRGEFYFFD